MDKGGYEMKVYIGYIEAWGPCPNVARWISTDKKALKKKIREYEEEMGDAAPETWITEYDLRKGEVLDLDD